MIDGKAKMMHVGSEGWPDACGVIWSSRWATIAQITEKVNSPDLSPIKHLWDVLDKVLRFMEAAPRD